MEGLSVDDCTNPRPAVRMSKPLLKHVFQDDNLRDLVLQHLQTTDLLAIARTCKTYRKLIMETRFNLNAKLKRFNLDSVVGFRTELGRSGALISGSFALQFLLGTRTVWTDSDLDVLVGEAKIAQLERFLVEKEGFALNETPQLRWSKCGVECRTYSKTSKAYGTAIINLIQCKEPPIQVILSGSYSSCVVNFISWNKAYSIFPRTTFINRQTAPLTRQNNSTMRHFEKYEKRGFDFVGAVSSSSSSSSPRAGTSRHRSVGDKHTWTFPLDTTGVTPPAPGDYPPDFVLESCTFNMHYEAYESVSGMEWLNEMAGWPPNNDARDADGRWRCVRLCTSTYKHPSLQYSYTDTDHHDFFDKAFERALDRETFYLQMVKIGMLKWGAPMSNEDYHRLVYSITSCPYVSCDPRLRKPTYLDNMVEQRKDHLARGGYEKSASRFELLGC